MTLPSVVGTPTAANSTVSGTGVTSIPWTSVTAGNVILLFTITNTAATVTSVTGGGASVSWSRVAGPFTDTIASNVHEIWMGRVATPGNAAISVTWSVSVSAIYQELDALEFTNSTGASTTWAVDGIYGSRNNTSSTTLTYPTLTPTAPSAIYFGHGAANSKTPSAGTTTGFSWMTDSGVDQLTWNPALAASASPTSTISAAAITASIAVLIRPVPLVIARPPANSTARRRAANW